LTDVYSDSTTAKESAEGLKNDGYNAKIAVEFSQGEIVYRVHIVGIENRESGEKIVASLSAKNQYPILQLRQYL
jgi:putative heme degradation protein